jgi:hypothetical protein
VILGGEGVAGNGVGRADRGRGGWLGTRRASCGVGERDCKGLGARRARARGTRRGEVGADVLAAGSARRRARVWGLGCAGEWAGARAGPNGRDGPGRGEAAAQGGLRARWAAGWGVGPFLFLFFFMFCSFLFSPPFQIELLIKRTLHKITHSRK